MRRCVTQFRRTGIQLTTCPLQRLYSGQQMLKYLLADNMEPADTGLAEHVMVTHMTDFGYQGIVYMRVVSLQETAMPALWAVRLIHAAQLNSPPPHVNVTSNTLTIKKGKVVNCQCIYDKSAFTTNHH